MATDIKDNKNLVVSKRRFVRVTPDKARYASYLIREKKVSEAMNIMSFSRLAAARFIFLTLKNAVAIAKDRDLNENDLFVKQIIVDEGPKLKRRRIIHQGRATEILKRMSHITVVLTDEPKSKVKNKKSKIMGKQK